MIKRNYKERLNIDFHFIDVCAPYKIWDEHGMKYMVYTVKLVKGPKPETTNHKRRLNR